MGKKARKLRSPKYANKASALRDTFARLRGQITETVETVVETVTKQVIVAAEKAEQVLDQTQERVNALRFTNENEVVQAEEPKVEQTVVEQPKIATPATKNTNITRKNSTSTTRKRRASKTKTDT
tara:strand:+ start:64 stop:438 length:375 start_codon:yes stop_codon:yes gene_type:complete